MNDAILLDHGVLLQALLLPDIITEEVIVLLFVWLALLSSLLWIAFVVFYRRR